jgi:hypothetical protein
VPKWFSFAEKANPETMKRIAASVSTVPFSLRIKSLPTQAHWFALDSLLLANRANREGMHANALALIRQCIEAISVIEVGLCGHPDSETVLLQRDEDRRTPGDLRKWLSQKCLGRLRLRPLVRTLGRFHEQACEGHSTIRSLFFPTGKMAATASRTDEPCRRPDNPSDRIFTPSL